jgi:hypothetical protein
MDMDMENLRIAELDRHMNVGIPGLRSVKFLHGARISTMTAFTVPGDRCVIVQGPKLEDMKRQRQDMPWATI